MQEMDKKLVEKYCFYFWKRSRTEFIDKIRRKKLERLRNLIGLAEGEYILFNRNGLDITTKGGTCIKSYTFRSNKYIRKEKN